MRHTSIHRALAAVAILAGALIVAPANAKDTKTEEPVFEFSSPFVAPPAGAGQTHYIWKINRTDGSLYLCQTTTANIVQPGGRAERRDRPLQRVRRGGGERRRRLPRLAPEPVDRHAGTLRLRQRAKGLQQVVVTEAS